MLGEREAIMRRGAMAACYATMRQPVAYGWHRMRRWRNVVMTESRPGKVKWQYHGAVAVVAPSMMPSMIDLPRSAI